MVAVSSEGAETSRFSRAQLLTIVVAGSFVALALRLVTGVQLERSLGQSVAGLVGATILVLVFGDRLLAWLNRAAQRH